ncbi:MAG TPA: hypothetical protein VFJ74_00190 [Gemmatimonadaceae bacterium]|nr:hypothetical protein [Gemmatimonadaceae bacterium]
MKATLADDDRRPEPPPSASGDGRRATLGLLAAAVLLVLPMVVGQFVPIVDLPNHLARVYIIRHLHEVPAFDATFRLIKEPIPNVAADVVLYGLLRFMEPLAAARAFLAITALLFAGGCWALAYAVRGRPSWTAVPASLLFFCSPLLYGFVNYVFGVALFCLAYAAWLVARRRWTAVGFATVAALTMAAYLAHLTAYAFVGFAVVVTALMDAWERQRAGESVGRLLGRLVVDGAPLVPPLVAFAVFMRGSGQAGTVVWNGAKGKVVALFGLVRTYDARVDLALTALIAASVVAVLWAGGRRPRIARDFHGPLLAVGVGFLVVFLLSPREIITSSGADARLILPAGVCLLVSYVGDGRVGRRAVYAAALVAVLAARVGYLWYEWERFEPAERRALALLDQVPEGARIFPIFSPGGGADQQKRERVFRHFVHYATVRHDAFVPSLFALRGQQPLVFRDPPPGDMANESPAVSRESLAGYDYVWSCGTGGDAARDLAPLARPLGVAAPCVLWQVAAGAPAAAASRP